MVIADGARENKSESERREGDHAVKVQLLQAATGAHPFYTLFELISLV